MTREREVYAVCHYKHGWLTDSCAGGSYSAYEHDAKTWPTPNEAEQEMTAAELGRVGVDYEIVPIVEPWKPVSPR